MNRSWSVRSFAPICALLFLMVAVSATAQPVTSLALNPSTITGGTGGISIGTVTIGAAAGTGGQVITLTSSNTDLAASTPRIVIPAGATSATFIVGTNADYRRYSGLAFTATITARSASDGSSASALLNVTAQAIPGPFSGGTNQADARATAGNICGSAFGSGQASDRGILFRCQFPGQGQFSVCSFLQECAFGCQTVSADRLNRRDACAAAPNSIAVNPVIVEGGRRSDGTVFLSAPAAPLTNANVQSYPGGIVSPAGGFDIPQGNTSAPFDVDTLEAAVPAFVQTSVALSLNPQERFAHDYLAVVPSAGSPRPSGPLAAFLLDLRSLTVVQGNPSIATIVLNGVAPSGGAVVSLSSSHPAAASVPATVTVPAGHSAGIFGVSTGAVPAATSAVIRATFGGVTVSETLIVSPFVSPTTPPAVASLALTPTTVPGGKRSRGRVTMTASAPDPSDGPVTIELASDRPDIAVVQKQVTVGFGGTIADFAIKTFAVATPTQVMITASYSGLTRSAILTVDPSAGAPPPPPPPPPPPTPPPSATLTAVSVNPTTVVGGNASTGTVTLNAAAPSGGATVSLSENSTAVSVPASVTVPAGATSATFTAGTTSVTTSTSAAISAAYAGVTRTATLTVNPSTPPPGQTATLTVTATGRSGVRVTSTPTGINVAVGSTGSASFAVGTSITLRATDGRDVIWSGACSSGGNKRKTCTFTLNAAASVTANVR